MIHIGPRSARESWFSYIVLRILATIGILLSVEILITKFYYQQPDGISAVSDNIHNFIYHIENGSTPLSMDVEVSEEKPGKVEGSAMKSKSIVASTNRQEKPQLNWMQHMLPDFDVTIYVVDAPSWQKGSIARNKGREASGYLTYIINHYVDLPDYMFFIHGKRYQSHNDDPMYDTLPEITNISLSYIDEYGYVPLRCAWEPGCPGPDVSPKPGNVDGFWDISGLYAAAFKQIFPNRPIPKTVSAPCCAQFAVTRETVQRWPVSKYEEIRQWMWETPVESMKIGLVLEYMWHIIFGKPDVWCGQPAKDCYCKKWGLCDLDCPRADYCKGRRWTPPTAAMPEGWPAKHQGVGGWPKYGWWENDV